MVQSFICIIFQYIYCSEAHKSKYNRNVILHHLFLWRCDPTQVMASFLRFLDHTQRRTTVGRAPLDEWSIRRRNLYLTLHNAHNRQISMPPVRIEPTISTGERPQTYSLHRVICTVQVINSAETCPLLIVPSARLSTAQQSQIAYKPLFALSGRGCLVSWQRCCT
jgi:hypothetical protein